MQIRFAIDYNLRRTEFVEREQLFPPVMTLEVQPHQLSLAARGALAVCNPELPELFELLAPQNDDSPGADTGHLWNIKINPNTYSPQEIVEFWAKEFNAARAAANDE